MFEIKAKDKMVERALLVGAYTDTSKKAEAASLLAELEELVDTLSQGPKRPQGRNTPNQRKRDKMAFAEGAYDPNIPNICASIRQGTS